MNLPEIEVDPVFLNPVLVQALDLEAYPIVENPKPSSVEAMALVVVPQTQEPLEVSMIWNLLHY